jgi:hypothetical protein
MGTIFEYIEAFSDELTMTYEKAIEAYEEELNILEVAAIVYEELLDTIPSISSTHDTKAEKRIFTLMSTKGLVSSLTSKYDVGAHKLPSIELLGFQKTQIEETFLIGDTNTQFYKNGSKHRFNRLSYRTFNETGNPSTYVDNLLVCKILRGMGKSVSYGTYRSDYHTLVDNYNEIDGLYRVKETSIYKLLHSYDMSTNDLRMLAKELDHRDVYIHSSVMREQHNRFQRLIVKICDTIDDSYVSHGNFITVTNPYTKEKRDMVDISGDMLDVMIQYSVDELSRDYSGVDTNEALIEIEYTQMEDLEHGVSYFIDTYQIGEEDNKQTYIKDGVHHVESNRDLSISVFCNHKKHYYTNVCGLPHKVQTVHCDFTKACVTVHTGNKLTRVTIDEHQFEEYGIYSSHRACLNADTSKVTLDIMKAHIETKELAARIKKVELNTMQAEYSTRTKMLTELLKLTAANDKNALLVEKLKYEKAVADSELNKVQTMAKQYELGKSMLTDAIRLAT